MNNMNNRSGEPLYMTIASELKAGICAGKIGRKDRQEIKKM